jgi:hypothetical protein
MSTYETPIPGAFDYGQAMLAANTAYKTALTRLNQRRSATGRQYGYDMDIDPESGTVANMRVSASNPFGLYQSQRRQFAGLAEDAEQAGVERGIGFKGLGAQPMGRLQHEFAAGRYQLGEGLTSTMAGYQDEQNQAAYARDQAIYQAQLEAAREALMNRLFNPANHSQDQAPAYGDEGPTTTPSATAAALKSSIVAPTSGPYQGLVISPGSSIGARPGAKAPARLSAPAPVIPFGVRPMPKKKGGR